MKALSFAAADMLRRAAIISAFHAVVARAQELCRFDDPEYKCPASYDDLLSYYNQRDHQIIDRHPPSVTARPHQTRNRKSHPRRRQTRAALAAVRGPCCRCPR